MTDPETTEVGPAARDGRRALLHPTRNAAIGETAGTGSWVSVKAPGELEKVDIPEDNAAADGEISSVPTPWARLELFRDAIRDAPHGPATTDGHPFSGRAIQDILDALELLLFEKHMDGLSLQRRSLDLVALASHTERELEGGIGRFLAAVRDLAPEDQPGTQLTRLTVVTDARGRLLFATSPFTLFFTPADGSVAIPGYFADRERPRTLAERPPELAGFLADHLIPALARHPSHHPELQRLVALLQRQLNDVPHEHLRLSPSRLDLQDALEPIAGVPVGRVRTLAWTSGSSLRPTRGTARPLVLDDSVFDREGGYFPWVSPRRGTSVSGAADRRRLPGTAWRLDWVDPTRNFLVDNLLVLERAELDMASVQGREVYEQMSSRVEWRRPRQVLLPLSAEYFRYFTPADVAKHLKMEMSPDGTQITATLTIPTENGPRAFPPRVYTRGENIAAEEFYLSVWPDFVPDDGAFEWPFHGVFHLTVGRPADAFDVRMGFPDGEQGAIGDYGAPPVRRFPREEAATFYALEQSPEYVRVRLRRHPGSDDHVAEGVIVPRFEPLPRPAAAAWSVAVDLGTSNTSVAVRKHRDAAPELLELSARANATRRDLMRPPRADGSQRSDILRIIDTLFYPDVVRRVPFPTHIERTTVPRDSRNEAVFDLPGATATIPFTGELTSGNKTVWSGDLKWGGGIARIEQNMWTEQFLRQLLVLLYADAVRSGARIDDLTLRWSYPLAFTQEEAAQFAQRWTNVLRWFRESRLGAAVGEHAGERPGPRRQLTLDALRLPDESTSALWFFKTQPGFSAHDEALSIAVDLGGGTIDAAGYADGHGQFRSSILLGGRDLVGTPPRDEGKHPTNRFAEALQAWALERMLADSAQLHANVQETLREYSTAHARFSYLVRHPWFEEHRTELLEEPWFRSAQACILYYFGAVFFHLGVVVRADRAAGGRYEAPRRVIFGGNGSRFLEWLTGFAPFSGHRSGAGFFVSLFADVFEASLGSELSPGFEVSVSAHPKHEVALGLLTDEADHVLGSADAHPTGARADLDDAPGSIRMQIPVGEIVRLPGDADPVQPEKRITLSGHAGSQIALGTEPEHSMIRRYHDALLEGMGRAGAPHGDWPAIRDRMAEVIRTCDRSFYLPRVREELERRLRDNARLHPSVFAIEVAETLRELQQKLFPEPANA